MYVCVMRRAPAAWNHYRHFRCAAERRRITSLEHSFAERSPGDTPVREGVRRLFPVSVCDSPGPCTHKRQIVRGHHHSVTRAISFLANSFSGCISPL